MPSEANTYIKLYRSITDWRWFSNANTLQVFIYILSSANIRNNGFMGVTIHRGELATSYNTISMKTGLSIQQVRTCISHLKSTGEITTKRYSKFFVITIINYDAYQDGKLPKKEEKSTFNQQSLNNHLTITQQSPNIHLTTIKEYKNNKNGRMEEWKKKKASPSSSPSAKGNGEAEKEDLPRQWEKNIPEIFWGRFDSEDEWLIWSGQKEKVSES